MNARALHVDGYDTAAATLAARWAQAAGIPVIADLDEIYPGVEDLIENVDYLIVSRDFPCRLMKDRNLENALRRMHSRYGCRLSAATLGPDGVLAWDGKQLLHSAAYRVPVVDTTGAGDIFHAGFIYGLLQDWPLERQLDFSCAAAAMNCMAHGARGGIQPVDAIENLMATVARYENRVRCGLVWTEQRWRALKLRRAFSRLFTMEIAGEASSTSLATSNAKPELPYSGASTAESMRPTGSSDLRRTSTGHTNSGFAVNPASHDGDIHGTDEDIESGTWTRTPSAISRRANTAATWWTPRRA